MLKRAAANLAGALLIAGLVATPARAGDFILPGSTTYYIGTGSSGLGTGCDSPTFGTEGGDATPVFASAYAGAASGDIIFVCEGTFVFLSDPFLNLAGRTLTIKGAGSDKSHLDGNGAQRVLRVEGGGNLELRNLHFTHGGGDDGWGAGAVYGNAVHFYIQWVLFDDNAASGGVGGALYFDGGSATIDHSSFHNNWAGGYAGAIFAVNADLDIAFSDFYDNYSISHDGAVGSYNGNLLKVRNSTFVGNRAIAQYGGAIHAQNLASADIQTSRFEGNLAGENGGAVDLCGITRSVVANSLFTDNHADLAGGALGIFCGSDLSTKVYGNRFVRNTAGTWGGGVNSGHANNVSMGGNLFDRNRATWGGGATLWTTDGWTRAELAAVGGNTFTGNIATVSGGGILIDCGTSTARKLLLSGNAFSGNAALGAGAARTKEVATGPC